MFNIWHKLLTVLTVTAPFVLKKLLQTNAGFAEKNYTNNQPRNQSQKLQMKDMIDPPEWPDNPAEIACFWPKMSE